VLVLLGAAVAASFVLLLGMDSHLTFIADDWELLVKRQGWSPGVVLDPFHENIVLAPAIVYKLMVGVFGMGSATPFYVLSLSLFLTSAVLLFLYARRRIGDWPALIVTILVLYLGAAFEDLLWAFQVGYFGSVVAGVGMLLALDRESEKGDRLAAGLLAVSLAFSSLGLPFAAGALVEVMLGRRPIGRRLYMPLLPLSLFALWWIGWGHTAESHVSLHNVQHLLSYAFNAAAAGIVSVFGLATGDGTDPSQPHLIWGRIALVVLLAAIGMRIYREGRLPRGLAVVLAIGLAFWVLAGLNHNSERPPASSRYQYPSAVFLLLIVAETARGLRAPKLAIVGAAALAGLAISGGLNLMHREYTERWRPVADSLRSNLAAVDIAGPSANPAFPIAFAPSPVASAGRYLDTAEAHGTPAFTETQLAGRPEAERMGADLTIARALGLALVTPGRGTKVIGCETLAASSEGPTGISLLHGGFTFENRTIAPVQVLLSRFASELSVSLGSIEPGVRVALDVPVDNSSRAWALGLKGAGAVRLCTTA
jgi:hypothetical protein